MEIGPFRDAYSWLSNFGPGPVAYYGIKYPHRENAYQAAKYNSRAAKLYIASLKPGQAKRAGGGKMPSEFLNSLSIEGWDNKRVGVMEEVVLACFQQNKWLADKLIETKDAELIEYNVWHDCFWGRCTCQLHKSRGENHLGRILMQVRKELHNEKAKQLGELYILSIRVQECLPEWKAAGLFKDNQ